MFSALWVPNLTPIFSFSAVMPYEFGLFSCNETGLLVGWKICLRFCYGQGNIELVLQWLMQAVSGSNNLPVVEGK